MQSEWERAVNKKDALTYWSLVILLGIGTIYFGAATDFQIVGWEKLALIIGTLIILIQFFVNSLLVYGFMKKWMHLREAIEKYWLDGKPTVDQIKQEVKKYDHGRELPVTVTRLVWGQLRAGFLPILVAPIIIATYELYKTPQLGYGHFVVFLILGLFLVWQTLIFARYDQLKGMKKTTHDECKET